MKILSILASIITVAHLSAQEPQKLNLPNAIVGTVNMGFTTRIKLDEKGNPLAGIKDNYSVGLSIAKATDLNGKIDRLPYLNNTPDQVGLIFYAVDVSLISPADPTKKQLLGKWGGGITITGDGSYDLGGLTKDKLQIAMENVGPLPAFTDPFAGSIHSEANKPEEVKSYARKTGDKEVKIETKGGKTIRFENTTLAMGPSQSFPSTIVSGSLEIDNKTGNILTNGLKFSYTVGSKQYEDVVTGSIKWIEDADRTTNGKGYYDFNLRWNEEPSDITKAQLDETAFFNVDSASPSLTGTIQHEDTLSSIGGKDVPTGSKTTYQLNANQLTNQQIMNFAKLWVVSLGPINEPPAK